MTVSSSIRDPFVAIFKGHYKLSLGGVFREGEKSASCASYWRSRVYVHKTLSNLLPTILFEKTEDTIL